ncbi:MAG: Rpn family recombination-promoting nuclease/putative transposase [Gemmatimonadetes bacterium]|nr:Rpn family recombination-promoting nuclease/putative transposase [Gemmatimonadota bacterium]
MRDPILKRLFGHAEVVEILIRDVLPEDARRIDLSTLEKLGTEFVGEALVRRYPDMMWTAHTRDGTGRVVILVEFQGRPDRLMPLRTAIYSHLAVQEMLRRSRPAPRPDSIEVLPPIVIYHGRGAWKGPTALGELFPRGIPREFRVIFRDPAGSESGTAAGLVGAIASLDRDTSMAGTLAELGRLVSHNHADSRVICTTGSRGRPGLLSARRGERSEPERALNRDGGRIDRLAGRKGPCVSVVATVLPNVLNGYTSIEARMTSTGEGKNT